MNNKKRGSRSNHISSVLRGLSGIVPVSAIKAGRLDMLVTSWEKIAGPVLAEKSIPGFIKGSVLQIIIDSKSTIMAMRGFEGHILKSVSAFHGMSGIKEIKFIVDPKRFKTKRDAMNSGPSRPCVSSDLNSSLESHKNTLANKESEKKSHLSKEAVSSEVLALREFDSELSEKFERFAATACRRREELLSKGAHECEGILASGAKCGRLITKGRYCPACRTVKLDEVRKVLEDVIYQNPGTVYEIAQQQMVNTLECRIDTLLFDQAREKVKKRLWDDFEKSAWRYKFDSSIENYDKFKYCADGLVVFELKIKPDDLDTKYYPKLFNGMFLKLLKP